MGNAIYRKTSISSTPTDYQQWENYPDSPVLTSDYPYQYIYDTGADPLLETAVYLFGFDVPAYIGEDSGYQFIKNTGSGFYAYIAADVDPNAWYIDGMHYFTPDIEAAYGMSENLLDILKEANADIYTDNTFTNVYFAKTTNETSVSSNIRVRNLRHKTSISSGGMNLKYTINNPNAYGTSASDYFGYSVGISNNYLISGAPYEDSAGYSSTGKAYIFSNETGNLLFTLNNPNAYGTPADDEFGKAVAICDSYAIVGAAEEDYSSGNASGRAYIYSSSTGQLLYSLDNPNAYGTKNADYFGYAVSICENYAIVGAETEDDESGSSSGKAYIFSTSTGQLLQILDNPNAYNGSSYDYFGSAVAISNDYAIVGAYGEDDSGGIYSGKAYIFSTSTGQLLHTLNNPNAYGTSELDRFGYSVDISDSFSIVGAYTENDEGGNDSGKAYVFSNSTGQLIATLNNPNAYDTSISDNFGYSVAISELHAVVGTPLESNSAGKVYVFSTTTWELEYTIDNPVVAGSNFGGSVSISGNKIGIGAAPEDDEGGIASGKAYIYDETSVSSEVRARGVWWKSSGGISIIEPSTDNLFIHYKFDDDTLDSSGSGIDPNYVDGIISYIDGPNNKAIDLHSEDGGAYIYRNKGVYSYDPDPDWQGPIMGFQSTICFWIKNADVAQIGNNPISLSEDGPQQSNRSHYCNLYITDNYEIGFITANDNDGNIIQTSNTYQDNDWHFVSLRYDLANDKITLDVDNERVLLSPYSHFLSFSESREFSIFIYQAGIASSLCFDDFRIYLRTLTDAEIDGLHNSGTGTNIRINT